AELRGKTQEFKERLSQGESLDDILPEAFAVVREAARRTIGMRHFDVQIIGAVVLHQGKIAEMQTGEGKTLVATMPAYLNALTGKGVHIVTVNDYLAKRDRYWMGPVYEFLGLSVGLIQHESTPRERQMAYGCDITYGTNVEFGFDYLRDNMVWRREDVVQRKLHYAIVDEVDSILIDEARTPLIISGPSEEDTEIYYKVDRAVRKLVFKEDFDYEEKTRSIWLTEEGVAKVEKLLHVDNLYGESGKGTLEHLVRQALRAHHLYKKDVDYVVKDGQVIIVDEFTGRLMHGRRYSEGLHQAIEAKEGLQVASENQTLASITYQNYFRMYEKLCGMTGTAKTEEDEFIYTYGMPVVVIPTNKPLRRTVLPDVIYRTEKEKFEAAAQEIERLHKMGRPVLVGTVSIEKSERLSELLWKRKIPHQVLNAKHHEKEAEIIAQAGKKGTVTISTNMAGRGTDILLGGNPDFLAKQELRRLGFDEETIRRIAQYIPSEEPEMQKAREKYQELYRKFKEETDREAEEVKALGGLHVMGTERHESRRIDNQLRGRAGRQGDPGSSQFFLSLEDDLLRLFGGERISNLMSRLGIEEGVPIEHPLVNRAIESAQKKVEGYHFGIRKTLLQYDDVMNKQREVIYSQRRRILFEDDLSDFVMGMLEEVVQDVVSVYADEKTYPEEWDWEGLNRRLQDLFGMRLEIPQERIPEMTPEKLKEIVLTVTTERYRKREAELGKEVFQNLARYVILRVVDHHWKEHLYNMDHLREGIGLRAVGQKDPFVEYQMEAFAMFQDMVTSIREDAVRYLLQVQVVREGRQGERPNRAEATSPSAQILRQKEEEKEKPKKKVGRNDPCPCGSGRKYKYCCGKN
ncbi:MAG: preprotein translocase subunit SecA, partial [Candidatus Atribacteria bacterium]|nr:preprotein translocase subunit SecA [Candidatus Atribacteria bacterium]